MSDRLTEFLVTRPEHDDVTFLLSEWFFPILTECTERGIKYLDLYREKANQKQVRELLSKSSAKLVVFNGHGAKDRVTGHKNEILIKTDESMALLKNRIVYAVACDSAASLGPECVNQGTTAYIGYKLPFVIISNPNKGFSPLKDEFAKPVMEASNEVTRTLLKKHSVDEAYLRSQSKFNYYIKKYQRADASAEAQNILPILYWDRMAQTKIGNGAAKLT